MAVRFKLYYFTDEIREYLQGVINGSRQGVVIRSVPLTAALPEQTNHDADVYLVEYDETVPGMDQWIEKIQHQQGHPAVYLYLREASTETLLKALRLGVQECFVQQIGEEEFSKAIQRLLKIKTGLKPGEKTQIISVLGCKGGAGVTFIAVNLAHSLAAPKKEGVLLCDLDLGASDVSSFLDMQPKYTIMDLVENFDKIDPQYLRDIVYSLESGLEVLPGPPRLEEGELLQAQHIDNILTYIRNQSLYRWLVLDLGDHLDDITLKALERSDLIVLVVLLTIPGLRDAKKILETFKLLEFKDDKIQLLVNSFKNGVDIKLEEGEKFLGREFLAVLRYDHGAVVRSINEGRPLLESQPRHRLSGDFAALVDKLQAEGSENGHRPGMWAGLKRLLRLGGKS